MVRAILWGRALLRPRWARRAPVMNAGLLRALLLPAPPLACEVCRVVFMGTFPSWVEGALGSAELADSTVASTIAMPSLVCHTDRIKPPTPQRMWIDACTRDATRRTQ